MKNKDFYFAVTALYPHVDRIVGEKAYDLDGKEVAYDMAAVQTKAAELQTEEENKVQAAHDKLAALGLTPEDLRRILG
jgi:hypothetical protein